jgi:rhodanese-related sulfurtransferase
MALAEPLERLRRREHVCRVPTPIGDGRFRVDGTWGTVQPIEIAPGVTTIGELELLELLSGGALLIDTRQPELHRERTIPGARGIPHDDIAERIGELDPSVPAVLFCNGPQCKATPDAVRALLAAGYPPEALRYYRGGMHDWMTLGYPTVPGR